MSGPHKDHVTENFVNESAFQGFDFTEIIKRMLKYLVEGMAVAFAAHFIPKKKPCMEEVLVIGATAAATFAVLDMYTPSISSAARTGAGFGVGMNLVGFPSGPAPMV
jgi:hypothetical protein